MATLDYGQVHQRKPYRYRFLVVAGCGFAVAFGDYLLVLYSEAGFPGPPVWILVSGVCSLIATVVGILSGVMALVTIGFRSRSVYQLVLISVAALFFLLGTPFAFFLSDDRTRSTYHHPAYLRLMSDARGVAQSACIFAADHAGQFPPHQASLILSEGVLPKQLCGFDLAPYVAPMPLPPEAAWPTIAADVDAHSIFVYTGGDLVDPTFNTLDGAIIVVYTKPLRSTPGYRIVAFADGHAELIADKDLAKHFATSNAARAKIHRPPFILDGPPPRPWPAPLRTAGVAN